MAALRVTPLEIEALMFYGVANKERRTQLGKDEVKNKKSDQKAILARLLAWKRWESGRVHTHQWWLIV